MPYLVLNFGTITGGSKTIRIPHINRSVATGSTVRSTMDLILSNGIFDGPNGMPLNVRGAALVEVTRTPMDVL